MGIHPENYAQALIEEAKKTAPADLDLLLKNFVAQIIRHGDYPLFDKILGAVEKSLAEEAGGRVVDLEFARVTDEKLLPGLTKAFTKSDVIKVKINPALVAGVRVTINGEKELDNSLRGKLNKVFA